MTPEDRFCGQPGEQVCSVCAQTDHSIFDYVSPSTRREVYGEFLRNAEQVIAPSKDSAARLQKAFPDIVASFKPHDAENLRKHRATPAGKSKLPRKIAVLGSIGPQKGVHVLTSLAIDASNRNLPLQFRVIGHTSNSGELARLGVIETGRYDSESQAIEELRAFDPDFVLMPSISPETFGYTLSIAFAAGVPVVSFDIGAQAERIKAANLGIVLGLSSIENSQTVNDQLLSDDSARIRKKLGEYSPTRYKTIIGDYYNREGASRNLETGSPNGRPLLERNQSSSVAIWRYFRG